MQLPSAGPPLEIPDGTHVVGRRSVALVDPTRESRRLEIELWYPAAHGRAPLSTYEVLPGVVFTSAGAHLDAPVHPGPLPLVLLSHGRTGSRLVYSMFCESLAACGAIVVAADHPGDALMDWLLGRHSDDRTNEINRVADARLLLDVLLGEGDAMVADGSAPVPAELIAAVDPSRVVLAGHSYGAYTAFATVAGARGVPSDDRVRAVIGLQAYTRITSDRLLGAVDVPTLLVVSEEDHTTPPATDAERPFTLVSGSPLWRLDLALAGHHASSDVALYAELVHQLDGVPAFVRQYLEYTAGDSRSAGAAPWRHTLAVVVRTTWAFLQVTLGLDATAGAAAAASIGAEPGVQLRIRVPA